MQAPAGHQLLPPEEWVWPWWQAAPWALARAHRCRAPEKAGPPPRQWGCWRCWPGPDQSSQILNPLHPTFNPVLEFFPLAARHHRLLTLRGRQLGHHLGQLFPWLARFLVCCALPPGFWHHCSNHTADQSTIQCFSAFFITTHGCCSQTHIAVAFQPNTYQQQQQRQSGRAFYAGKA